MAVDVVAVGDGSPAVVGMVEHLDSARVTPPFSLAPDDVAAVSRATVAILANRALRGPWTARFALSGNDFCLLDVAAGSSSDQRLLAVARRGFAVACPSATGEAIACGADPGSAFAAAMSAAGTPLPLGGRALLAVASRDRRQLALPARALVELGFDLVAGEETALLLRRHDVPVAAVGPTEAADLVRCGRVHLVVDTARALAPGPAAGRTPVVGSIRGLAVTVQGIQTQQGLRTGGTG